MCNVQCCNVLLIQNVIEKESKNNQNPSRNDDGEWQKWYESLKLGNIYNRLSCVDSVYLCFPTCSLSPFLQFFLAGRSMDSLGQENLIFLQLDINLNFTWHFMFFLYLGITNKSILSYQLSLNITCLHRPGLCYTSQILRHQS